MPTLDLSIIIVSWNVRDLLHACLVSLRDSPGVVLTGDERPTTNDERAPSLTLRPSSVLNIEVIVVDNASSDGSAVMVATEFPWVRLVVNPDNRGFTRANNQGLALGHGRYVLFLNPDTEVVGGALATMVSYLDAHPQVGALGPQLRYADGSLQPSRRRFPTFATALFESTPLAWHWPDNRWARHYRIADRPDDEIQQVDWVVGAALLVRRQALDQVGGFDEGYFMYSEELISVGGSRRPAGKSPICRRPRSSTMKANRPNRSWRPATSASRPAKCAISASSTAFWRPRPCAFFCWRHLR